MKLDVHGQRAAQTGTHDFETASPTGERAAWPTRWCSEPVQFLCSDFERRALSEAASGAGLTISGFLLAAGLGFAGARVSPPTSAERALPRESVRLGGGLTQTIPLLREAIVAAPVGSGADRTSLRTALHHCEKTVGHSDQLTPLLHQRLS